MTPEDIYNAVKDLTPYQVKKWYVDNNITEQQKKAYQNFKNAKNVKKSRDKNREGYNQYQNGLMKEIRQASREADNEIMKNNEDITKHIERKLNNKKQKSKRSKKTSTMLKIF